MPDMETQKICPNCRKPLPPDVPLGLCPECLIKSGFPTGTEPGVSSEAAGERFVPPTVEEIAQLFPQLEILGFIGKGGMGAVYKARQPALDRFVALKVLPPAVAGDPGFAERFNREARALARLNHPNIVAVHDFGQAGTLHYLVMEFVDGANLREVEHAGRLSPEQALAIVPQICEALQFAHNEGIVHRDIKPENLLMDKKGRVKITDFGIAKIVGVTTGKVSLTGVKDVVGTPHYMAPEQIEKPLTVDHRADIYSLGVVFYEMLTGELPLGKFQAPSKKVQIDVRLDEVVLHALEKEPEHRYQQASQVKTAVETIAGTAPEFAAQAGIVPSALSIAAGKAASDKAILPAFLLAFFFGVFGAHRFYVGKIWTACVQLGALGGCILLIIACATTGGDYQPTLGILLGFLICGCGIWATIDWILIACKAFTDGQGRRITHWLHPQNGDSKAGTSPITGPPATPPPGRTVPPTGAGPQPAPFTPGKMPPAHTGIIAAPAVGLMVAAIWKLFSALMAFFFIAGWFSDQWLGTLKDFGIGSFSHWSTVASFGVLLFKVIPALLILVGAVQMLRLRSYAWAIAAGILSIVACSLVGLPIGIWALIVLARDDVKSAFEANASAASSAPQPGRSGQHLAVAMGCLFLVFMAIAVIAAAMYFLSFGEPRDRANDPPQNPLPADIRLEGGEFRKDLSRLPLPLNADGSFSLDNVNGRIEIHGWSSNVVIINATIHGNNSESVAAANMSVVANQKKNDSNSEDIVVHTLQPSNITGFSWRWLWSKSSNRGDANVDYTIQVPQNAHLKNISSVNGQIVIEDVSGSIEASAVNGEVQTRGVAGDLKLSTVNGRIEAELASLGGSQTVSLTTVNGHIEATLPANADAAVSASTLNGGLSSDFPGLVVTKQFPIGSKLKGTLGHGSAHVEASSVNGGIHFQQGRPAASASPASHPDSKAETAALSAVQTWLSLMDNGNYGESWETAGDSFHGAIAKADWVAKSGTIRQPLGKVLSRTLSTMEHLSTLPGMPDGSYFTARFETAFDNLKPASETVTFARANDGQWKAIAYLILPATAETTPALTDADKAATAAAQAWLSLIDGGHYSESWNEASAIVQGAVTETAWENLMTTFRKPLGSLISRKLKSAQPMTEMPGAPDGQYVVMQFDTSFEAKKTTIETVTFKLEKDGQWKSAGYYIK
jgi:predicted Ser/Thr protein kinase